MAVAFDSKRLAELVAQNKAKQAGTSTSSSTPYYGMPTSNNSSSSMITPGLSMTNNNAAPGLAAAQKATGGSSVPYYGMTSTAMNGLSVPTQASPPASSTNKFAVPQSVKDAVTAATQKVLSPGYVSTTTPETQSTPYYDANFKGVNNYAANQQTRYNQAKASGDVDLIRRLQEDAKRVGYTLTEPGQSQRENTGTQPTVTGQAPINTGNMVATPNGTFPAQPDLSNVPVPPSTTGTPFTPPTPSGTTTGGGNAADLPTQVTPITPAIPVMDEAAIRKYAEDQTNRKLSDLRLDADQQIQTGKTTTDAQIAAAQAAYEAYIRQLQANYDQTTGTAKTDAAKQLAAAQASYDQYVANANANAQSSLGAIQTQYDRQSQNINQDRGTEDVRFDRTYNPFSGQKTYAQGILAQERARTDRERMEDLEASQGTINNQLSNYLTGANQTLTNAQSGINQSLADILAGANQTLGNAKTGAGENLENIKNSAGQSLADLTNQINAKYAALQNAAPDEKEALFQSIKNDERNYQLMLQGQLNQDLLTNSQLNNTGFNQALAAWQANEAQRQQNIQNDANYAGIYGNAPTFQAQQQAIDNLANYAGTFNGNPTFQAQQAAFQNSLAQQQLAMQQQQANNSAALDWSQLSGQILTPQQDWSGYARQIQNGSNPLTLQAQQQQANNNQFQQQLQYQQARDAIQDKQWQAQFDQDVRQYGLNYALQKNAQAIQSSQWQQNFNQGVSEFNKNYGLQQDQNDLNWIEAENRLNGNNQSPQYNGMSANQVSNVIKGQIFGEDGALKQGVTPDAIWQTVVGYGLPDGQDDQVMMSLGLTRQQITDLDKKYGATGG